MRIAVSYAEGKVYQHFGHTVRFKIYDVEGGEVRLATTVNTNGSSGGALPDILRKLEVNALICGSLGTGAKRALADAGIRLYSGVTGEADKAVEALLKGSLEFDPDAVCRRQGERRSGS
ncbi:NifB/NifX family molybdenum-iron cluster-binding protein [Papillibacter cinnamivorans]|uniref:Predicted Fe-Mo cluster-binding protein, NifX family n=1 Tax=Papillibacter cinnamivorans DSM 12816 TaxID=1122930 RepID=A0A1W1YEC0_9FIRM|nr:NifB/NifX family molybdenum-iron cluster-binding protein [Papillibacter cinnamivorans]SMC34479.1 Predicted Fe-Mo cluster-binding protein, NifX family [Papillibacter cinnamivorans DSM 12816]